ncbi:MAG: polyamine aminopropyltransferase [Planctomycetes bacterium]|nr:polyamine aminopropyltransferase [Planctomycetota bacterium]
MDLWFTETFGDVQAGWRIKQVLYQQRSRYQDVVVLDTVPFGRMLVLDGCVMTTERDEFAYHEMLVHPGLLAHPRPRAVCIVGGGDGGTVREVLKHATVERVVLAEIDEEVIAVSRKYLPSLASGLSDPRVEICVGDGAQYLREHEGDFDVVLSDSTDPIGPGVVLFGDDYFASAKRALRGTGLFVTQCKSLWVNVQMTRDVEARLAKHFRRVLPYVSMIPTYPTGSWSFHVASDGLDPRAPVDRARQEQIAGTTRYYTAAHQSGAFAVPAFYGRPADTVTT